MDNSKVSQTSRIYFRRKDHKDAYFDGKFHGAMYYKGADATVDNLIWRKTFNDRYFAYQTAGVSEWADGHGICYPKNKINIGNLGQETYYSARTGKYLINTNNYWADYIYIYTEDEKCIKGYSIQSPFRKVYQYYGLTNTIIARDDDHNFYYTTLEERENVVLPPKWRTMQSLISKAELVEKGLIYSATLRVAPRGTGKLALFTTQLSDCIKGLVWNEETNAFSDSFNLPHSNPYFCFANGKIFILCSANWVNTYIYEVTDSGCVQVGNIPCISGTTGTYDMGMRYADGIYYLYLRFSDINKSYVFTSNNLTNWTPHELPRTITVNPIPSGTWRGPLVIYTDSSYISGCGYYESNMVTTEFPMFENNKRLLNQYDLAFHVPRVQANSNYAICYFDNPLLEESDNNFYFMSSDSASTATPQKMWEEYYKEET